MFDARAVANYFIDRHPCDIEVLFLNKIVFIAHGWHLACLVKPLINEPVVAGPYGPLINSVYLASKHHCKNRSIVEYFVYFDYQEDQDKPYRACFPKETADLLNRVWEQYQVFTSAQMSAICHMEGTPWHDNSLGPNYQFLENEDIRKYYVAQAQKNRPNNETQTQVNLP